MMYTLALKNVLILDKECSYPVSYTHLDVYKRQRYYSAILKNKTSTHTLHTSVQCIRFAWSTVQSS